MTAGLMMNSQLTITSIMKFAERVHPRSEIVSLTKDSGVHRYFFADAFRRSRQLANALAAAGVQAGDRVGTLAWNDYRHLELYYAVSCSGAVCHTINPRLFTEQIEFIVNHAEDKLIFVDPDFVPLLEQMQDKLPKVNQFVVLTDDVCMPATSLLHARSYESFIGSHSDTFSWPDLDENTASALCYTSGTTGDPKGVLYSHRSTVLHTYSAAMSEVMRLSVNDVVMPVVPMFHVNAWGLVYTAAVAGSKLVLPGSGMGNGANLQNLIETEQVTVSAGVPTVWLALLDHLAKSGDTIASLERVYIGGAACPMTIMDEFEDRHEVRVHQVWGMTETSPLGTCNSLNYSSNSGKTDAEQRASRTTQGRIIYGIEMKIVDDKGDELTWDGISSGELKVRGPWVCSGYYKTGKSEAHDDEGWFSTGDVASIDDQGFVQITDRIKDVIKSGGEWISSIELENTATGHPEVEEAAVIGVAHPKWTERPLLVVVSKEGKTPKKAEILSFMADRIDKWWLPDDVVFVDEMPHTATGKLSKKDLRDQLADYQLP